MTNQQDNASTGDVPRQIFEEFFKTLENDKVPPRAVQRIRALLLSDKSLTEKAVTEALLSEDPIV